ncbi:Archaeal fructose-1,6-bisphosphatase SuhB [Methanonatronarchaeum thermophilum]|uniref:fructose-bisphosphatase n=1 Tax=Methanonatronarchaeum thermophilum TaxID=1927129 RepID=A0A1Y3GCB6_9EURY|nr:inositol monophosphatase family protein [Methanonatronarchaeum thermophilum]OUJ19039.1 Archaeal fructose-1,6-bisphosphatase SuhB [Methanonatronarchaeum thermophilum]
MKHQTLCKKLANQIEKNTKHLIGTKKASKTIKIGADGKPTKKIDLIAEKTAINYLSNKNIQLITEETGLHRFGKPQHTIILDPIDGTYNATNNIPLYSTSIAIADKKLKQIKYGYIKNLNNGDTYKSDGKTSKHNNQKITVSNTQNLKNASISYYGYNKKQRQQKERLNEKVHRIRTLGCISLEMCYVASGKLDAFIDTRGAGSTDIAAASIIIKGAGGKFQPIPQKFPTKHVKKQIKTIATNKTIHKEIQKTINQ